MLKRSRRSREPRWKSAPIVRGKLNSKAKGELGEMIFLHKASSLGFGVAKPFGDNERYDFILDSGERLWRVQVKSTYCMYGSGLAYRITTRRHNQEAYSDNEVDFLVGHIVPRNIWYIVPVKKIGKRDFLYLHPLGCKQDGGHFEAYRDAWHLMAAHGPKPLAG